MRISTHRFSKRAILVAVAAAAAVALPSLAQQAQPTRSPGTSAPTRAEKQAHKKAAEFIKKAARDNDLEIAMAQIGLRKAENPDLKDLSKKLKKDHQLANLKLQPLARKYGVSISEAPSHKHARELSRLEKEKAGPKFDKQYATELLRQHQKAILQFERAASHIQTPEVREYAQTTLPTLREHFQHTETAARAVGVNQSTIARIASKVPANVGGTGPFQETSQGAGAKKLERQAPLNPGAGTGTGRGSRHRGLIP